MRDKPLVTVFTCVYNNKRYTEQCIKSVLNQTYKNIEYIIVDNSSNDGVIDLIKKYEKLDDRIKAFYMNENLSGRFPYFLNNHTKGKYITSVDCDDYIEENFIEKIMNAMLENNLDIGIAGSCFHNEEADSVSYRKVDNDYILTREEVFINLPYLYRFFRTIWGKIYKVELLKNKEEDLIEEISKCRYGVDTIICLNAVGNSKKIGILKDVLHNYRIHGSSISYKFNPLRFKADIIVYEYALNLAKNNSFKYNERNIYFLSEIYYHAINDTLRVALNSNISVKDKVNVILDILGNENTSDMISILIDTKEYITKFVSDVIKILKPYLVGEIEEKITKYIYNILLKIDSGAAKWLEVDQLKSVLQNDVAICHLLKKKYNIFFFEDCKNELDLVKTSFVNYCRINDILNKVEDNDFYIDEIEVVMNILDEKYSSAINGLLVSIESKTITIDHIVLLKYLYAVTKNIEGFVYSKKLELYYWIYYKDKKKAEEIMNELRNIISDNEYFKSVQQDIDNI